MPRTTSRRRGRISRHTTAKAMSNAYATGMVQATSFYQSSLRSLELLVEKLIKDKK
jgi:hypothetical protein